MKFPDNDQIKGMPISNKFLTDLKSILFNTKLNPRYSHITGEIFGYTHDFCNRKLRKNKNSISVIAHNSFGFDFFFFSKSIRFGVKTTNLSVWGSNLSQINFSSISEVKIIDTMIWKSLAKIAESMMEWEKEKLKNESKRFLEKHKYFGPIFKHLFLEDQSCILN